MAPRKSTARWWLASLAGIAVVAAAAVMAAHHCGISIAAVREKAMRHIGHAAALALGAGGLAQAQAPSASPTVRPAVIGINLSAVSWGASTAPFANLAIASEWLQSNWAPLGQEHQDKDGNLLSVPADGLVRRFMLVPPTGPEGIDIRCTFSGRATLLSQGNEKPARSEGQSLTFHTVRLTTKPINLWLDVTGFDARQPLRNLDCRQLGLDRNVRFRSQALAPLRGFGVVRFMDWQNANANVAVTWAQRRSPGALRIDRDGIAIEDMLALAKEIDADPWFVMPWNADDDYVRRFAELVRDTLPAGRSVYVEAGNEVWNGQFPVSQQAQKEGVARGLAADPRDATTRRYAQRTVEVMRIWEAVFAGRKGLVRVLSTQQVDPEMANVALRFADTAKHVDAVSTSAYFGDTVGGTDSTRGSAFSLMDRKYAEMLVQLAASRRIAAAHGKRFVAYEGGPALVLPAQPDLLASIQRDPGLYKLTRRFLDQWAAGGGDVVCLYNSIMPPNPWGMWGLAAWENDTPAEAPKMHAAHDFIAGRRPATVPAATPIAR